VVERIIEAQRFAELDQYRATTHNKGIMNGIDAVAVALGQDWRAIEAAAHSYASIGQRYMPLTRYRVREGNFEGRIEMPLSVGTKGGAIETNPSYINTHQILGFPSSQDLAHIMAAVGLAQNLAAIRALSTEGIQRGHMNLHARNVAMQAGVPQDLVPEVVEFMKLRNKINVKAAQHYMNGHGLFKALQKRSTGGK
jgi:hydroxymethylglutaryl-CoA synthase